jgi:hypothetical protein
VAGERLQQRPQRQRAGDQRVIPHPFGDVERRAGVHQRVRAVRRRVHAPRKTLLDLDAHHIVGRPLGLCSAERDLACLRPEGMRLHPSEARERGSLINQCAAPAHPRATPRRVARCRLEMASGRIDSAPVRLGRVCLGRQPPRLLEELGRRVGSAPGAGATGRPVEGAGDRGVGPVGREREVPATFLRFAQDRCQSRVQLAAARTRDAGVCHRLEQRMGEDDARSLDLQRACRNRGRDTVFALTLRHRSGDDVERRARER